MQPDNIIHVVPNLGKQHKHDLNSAKIAEQIKQFKASGGKIQKIPQGVSGETIPIPVKMAGKPGTKIQRPTKRQAKYTISSAPAGYITIPQFARMLGKCDSWVYGKLRTGAIDMETIGTKTKYVLKTDAQKYVEKLNGK